jgi:hypothetical protein
VGWGCSLPEWKVKGSFSLQRFQTIELWPDSHILNMDYRLASVNLSISKPLG